VSPNSLSGKTWLCRLCWRSGTAMTKCEALREHTRLVKHELAVHAHLESELGPVVGPGECQGDIVHQDIRGEGQQPANPIQFQDGIHDKSTTQTNLTFEPISPNSVATNL
jgi:hypothetical protein